MKTCLILGSTGQDGSFLAENCLKNGMRVGSHSKSHKKLTLLDKKDAIDEIVNSKDELETLTGESVNSFC